MYCVVSLAYWKFVQCKLSKIMHFIAFTSNIFPYVCTLYVFSVLHALFTHIDEASSRIWGEIRLERKWVWTLERMGKMEEVDLGVFGTGGIHATWWRFQDKWGRSATLNQRFKDKDRWFWGEPRDLRENSLFHKTQI